MAEPVRLRTRRPCPICNKPSQQKFHPFCSGRCAQVDLNRWLGGHYAIPIDDPPDETAQGSGTDGETPTRPE